MKTLIAFNTISQLIGKLISGGITFVISLLLAKTLGVEGYGDFTKITTYVAFFYLFCDIGLNAAYLQLSKSSKSAQMRNSLFTLRLLLGLLLMFITVVALVFLPGSTTQGYTTLVKLGIIILIPSILFQSLITTTNAFFQQKLRYDYATYAIALGSIISLALVWISTIIFSPSFMLFAVIGSFLIGTVCTTIVAFILVKRITQLPVIVWDIPSIKQLLWTALPLGLTLIFNVIYFHADSIILTLTRPTLEVGIYGLAYKFFEFTLVIPTFFMNAVLPVLIEAYKKHDAIVFKKRITLSTIALACMAIGISGIGWVFTPLLSYIRPGFSASVIPLRLLLTGLPIFYLTSITMWILVVTKKQKQLIIIYGVSMIVNILLNIYFIPIYSYMAAAWITILTEGFVLAISVYIITISKTFTLHS